MRTELTGVSGREAEMCEKLRTDHDRFKEALEEIAADMHGLSPYERGRKRKEIAITALRAAKGKD